MVLTYKGFVANIVKNEEKLEGIILGLNMKFNANSEENCISEFHRIVDENMPIQD